MNKILNVNLNAAGNPSVVKARLSDQVQAMGVLAPDQLSVLTAARTHVEDAIKDISEDDTVAVAVSISIAVTPAPAIALATKPAGPTMADDVAEMRRVLADVKAGLDDERRLRTEAAAAVAAASTTEPNGD